ncbi:hypothetical protein GMOD_00007053 [Pyrenophora seminiperda CCB06]|uniref:Uncharacterized protein n=1 Tax=Pyrenophora seminiperda CCB06 TaxID=1302712 RepID=A0A3M7MC73_9PLEO|nr:hypothetical protein GMOD_00007053 [Pyrenophora seminiperda CCB06]
MPTFSLGPRLGRIQISRLPPSRTSRPKKHQNLPPTPPPEYAGSVEIDTKYHAPSQAPEYAGSVETDTKYHAPPQAQPPQCNIEQVRRFLIEIVAITFGANFDELNAALYNIPPPSDTNTILCDSERADLLAQSNLVRKVHGCFLRDEQTRIHRRDEKKLCATIIQPVETLVKGYVVCKFSLDVIGWYGEQVRLSSGTRWTSTIIGWWKTNPFPYEDEKKQVEESMESFLLFIICIAPNDKVHSVLREAWDDSRRRCGMGKLEQAKYLWPTRPKYSAMGNSLLKMMRSES